MNPSGTGAHIGRSLKTAKFLIRQYRVTTTVTVLSVLAVILLAHNSHWANRQELAVFKALSLFSYPSQLQNAQALCTDKGFRVLPNCINGKGRFIPAAFKVKAVKPDTDMSEIEMVCDGAGEKGRIVLRMVNDRGWKLDDVYVAESKSKAVNLWASEIVANPLTASLKINSDEILAGTEKAVDVASEVATTKSFHEASEFAHHSDAETPAYTTAQ